MSKLPRGLIFAAIAAIAFFAWRNAKPSQTPYEKAEAHVAFICGDDFGCVEESTASLPDCVLEASYDERRRPMQAGDALDRAAGVSLKALDACLLMATSNMDYAADAARR